MTEMLSQLGRRSRKLAWFSGIAALTASTAGDPSLCRLLLVRHGETNYNADGRLQGRLESELTEAGHAQADAVGSWLASAESSVDRVFVSPRRRTHQTLGHIESKHTVLPPAEVRAGLREIELTMWEGQYKSDLRDGEGNPDAERWAQWKAEPDSFVFVEDGHAPFGDLKRRAGEEWTYIAAVTAPETTSLVVAHGAFNRVFLLAALGLPVDGIGFGDEHFAFENCETVELRWLAGATHADAWRKRYPHESAWMTREAELERRARGAIGVKVEL
jgi:broad specificity phosphatase PhoE